jgi:glycerate kinase
MPKRVLILPDKFKGTLTAKVASETIAAGWRRARPDDLLTLLPMSDGGDGFGEVLGALLHAKAQTIKTIDAAARSCTARWWWNPETRTAIIESASVIGLAKLPLGRFHPFKLDTYGLGVLVRAAASKGAKRCLIGIGGTATNDAGFGLARSLGWKFIDHNGRAIKQWIQLDRLAHVLAPRRRAWFDDLMVAVDVQNPLLGLSGATRVYGPQKGLCEENFAQAEKCLSQLARVVKKDLAISLANKPGAGAGGGLGFGLMSFLGTRMQPGFELFASHATLDKQFQENDLVITGEGAIDDSTLMGKGVGEIVLRCRKLRIPCIGLAGVISGRAWQKFFKKTYALTTLTTMANAKSKSEFWLERLANLAAHNVSLNGRRGVHR